jgi:hypothetical protein
MVGQGLRGLQGLRVGRTKSEYDNSALWAALPGRRGLTHHAPGFSDCHSMDSYSCLALTTSGRSWRLVCCRHIYLYRQIPPECGQVASHQGAASYPDRGQLV